MTDKIFVLTMLSLFALLSAVFPASAQDFWLDQRLTNWNRPTSTFPQLPRPVAVQGGSANDKRCLKQVRQPASAAEQALVRRGWKLYGAKQRYEKTEVIAALSGFDGLCRPLGYQAFVYWEGRYAGTLSPVLMNSRTDGALTTVRLISETNLTAEFARYAASAPLCCPSRLSTVAYTLKRDDIPDLVPTNVRTVAMGGTDEQTASDNDAQSLFGKHWVLTDIGERRLNADKPYIEFDRDQRRVSGDSGCNRFTGAFESSGTALKLSRLANTRRACLSEEANRLEVDFLRLLETTTRFEVQADRLRLYANDESVLVFTKK